VRVADAILIDRSGISNEEYDYALKAHCDVLMVRNTCRSSLLRARTPACFVSPSSRCAGVMARLLMKPLNRPLTYSIATF
jgi:hypothetical protein